ncbi:aminoacyl-tRNA hydrolase [Rhodoluna sp.]|uniref:aminoacyl-tRNA hydrolase n=1 Tax=Rhodoluna sp. TaxID=1969481 RepID=UPI0025F253F9|nr:aminoacyl-tRNA hydrolase [Rhodoluna sp.]
MSNSAFLIVGLGNPGPDYSANRHNVGQMALSVLADRLSASFKSHKSNAAVAESRIGMGGPKVILAKPGSYMNTTGGPVSSLMKFYDIDLAHTIVLHDELDIDAETIRIKQGGGHAGHNGLRDIIAACGSNDFTRVRIGIGRPPGRMDTADFVLKDFNSTERKNLPLTLELAADAVEEIVQRGVLEAQNRFNPKG